MELDKDRWKNTLVERFQDSKKLSFSVVLSQEKLKWGNMGFEELMPSGNGIYLLKFNEENEFNEVLSRDPWTVTGATFMLKKWEVGDNLTPGRIQTYAH